MPRAEGSNRTKSSRAWCGIHYSLLCQPILFEGDNNSWLEGQLSPGTEEEESGEESNGCN